MIKNVMGLIQEIYKGNIDKLPEKIKIQDKILVKNDNFGTYFTENLGISLMELMKFLPSTYTLIEYLKLPVIKLRQLAEELNDDEKIDWENENQSKYYLTHDYYENATYEMFGNEGGYNG